MSENNRILKTDDLEYVKNRYNRRIEQHGATFESLNSGNWEKQEARYQVHTNAIVTENAHVLDIGCGLGMYYQYLNQKGVMVKYTGYDIMQPYIDTANEHFSEATFECRNIFEEGIEGKFDTIVMSQVLNNKYKKSDNEKVMKEAIKLAFEHSNVSISIDMMSNYVDYKNEDLYYYSPESIFEYAKSLTRRVSLRHDYRAFEFCIQLFHGNHGGFVQ